MSYTDITNETMVLLTEIAALTNLLGSVSVRPFTPKSLSRFHSLSEHQQIQRLELLKIQYLIIKLEASQSCRNGVGLWRFCKIQNLSADPAIYSHINDDSSIQILGVDDKHLYCNNVFYALTSHSIEDLVSLPFHELFFRSDELDAKYHEIVENMKAGEHSVVNGVLPEHRLTEINCESPKVLIYKMKKLAPIYRKDQLLGVVSITDTRHE